MPNPPAITDVDAALEDLAFLADQGISIDGAAERLGFNSASTLDKWLRRNNQRDLLARLGVKPAGQREPPRITRPPTRTALSEDLRRGARPLPALPPPHAPHRPWCVDCKRKHDADQLDAADRCEACARAVLTRAAAAERRAREAAEAKERQRAEQAELRRQEAAARRSPRPPKEGKQGQPTTRHSAPRARSTSRSSGRAPEAGSSITPRKNLPAGREMRPRPVGSPPGPRSTTDTTRIRRLYVDEQMSIPEIARATGHVPATIRRILIGSRIELRDDRRTRSGGKPIIDTPADVEAVRAAYVDEGLTIAQTVEKLGMAKKRVEKILHRHGIPRRPNAFSPGYQRKDQAQSLKQLIADLGVPVRQIKQWAIDVGLLDDFRVGLPAMHIVKAYAAAVERGQASSTTVRDDVAAFAANAPASIVRIWAAKNGHTTPLRGPVSREVRLAYGQAMTDRIDEAS